MSGLDGQRDVLAVKFEAILPHLDERQRRLLIGAEARSLGHGGIRAVARAAGVREATVSLGVRELDSGENPLASPFQLRLMAGCAGSFGAVSVGGHGEGPARWAGFSKVLRVAGDQRGRSLRWRGEAGRPGGGMRP
jgi:hypothetical protein